MQEILNQLLSLNILHLIILLLIFSFTNGLFLVPASQFILIIAGIISAKYNQPFLLLLIILSISNFLGNYLLYLLSYHKGIEITRKILPIKKKTFDDSILIIDYLFKKYGNYIILIGRNLPILHSLVSVPAGIAKINKKQFAIYTAIGILIWSLFFMSIGYVFGENYELFLKYINTTGTIITLIVIISYIYFYKKLTKKILLKIKKEQHIIN